MKFSIAFFLLSLLAVARCAPVENEKNPMENEGFFEGDIAGVEV